MNKSTQTTLYKTALSIEPELQHTGYDTVRRLVKGAANDLEMCGKMASILDKRKKMILTLSEIVEKLCKP